MLFAFGRAVITVPHNSLSHLRRDTLQGEVRSQCRAQSVQIHDAALSVFFGEKVRLLPMLSVSFVPSP